PPAAASAQRLAPGPAHEPGGLVIRRIVAVRVGRGRARLQPRSRRPSRPRDRLADHRGRADSRLEDLAAVVRAVAAVDRSPREIDDPLNPPHPARPASHPPRVPPCAPPPRLRPPPAPPPPPPTPP